MKTIKDSVHWKSRHADITNMLKKGAITKETAMKTRKLLTETRGHFKQMIREEKEYLTRIKQKK